MLTLSDKNLLLRFAYPIDGPPNIVSLCGLFWKTLFMAALWLGLCYALALAYVYPGNAAIVVGIIVGAGALAALLHYLDQRDEARRASGEHRQPNVVVTLTKAAYHGIKDRFCPVFRVVREGESA
jgi:hypothetical protein